ncbi:Phage repressor protein C, contains Cro/C1-type HTH and peptisase s24 domains [Sphingomonas sp. NFR04]|uniref:S24 family peptidase n=1 Tax=Sphingomonas sp. NFR04 TaxID=1566283 RepID=UPI0008E5B812|nr:LexA family transcriptional regulator [Sphingomonas sp. NFR04]SFJ47924.1 Phage repressor protein C, contains Cro/C1-type HTH and peptisase s24 domains [Sphingomonas sp. NFR04]
MTDPNAILIDRIDARLQVLNLSDRKASLNAIGKPDLIRDIRRGKKRAELPALARALATTVDFLEGLTDNPSRAEPVSDGAPQMPRPEEMEKDIPVYGTALGAEVSFWSEHNGEVAVEQTDLNTGEVIDYFRRPPALRDRRDVYMLYTAGSSMAPAFEEGSPIPVDPKRPPAIGNYVVVYLRDQDDEYAAGVLIKRLVKRSASFIELQQFNPPATFRLEPRQFRAVHRVMPWEEVLGV